MDTNKLIEIIDFAIEREEEAIEFYRYLQERADFKGQREHLEELEKMEEGHVKILERIKKQDLTSIEVPEVRTLRLSEYLVPVDDKAELDYATILKIAMKREEKAEKLYGELADQYASEKNVANLFRRLEAEESRHKLNFETLYDEEIMNEN